MTKSKLGFQCARLMEALSARLLRRSLAVRVRIATSRGRLRLLQHLARDMGAPALAAPLDWQGPVPARHCRPVHNGWTLLHVAADSGHFDIVKWLLEQGCPAHVKTSYHITPMHMAAQCGAVEIVSLLAAYGGQVDHGFPCLSTFWEDHPYTPSSIELLKLHKIQYQGDEHRARCAAGELAQMEIATAAALSSKPRSSRL